MHLQATRNWTPEFDAAIRPTLPALATRAQCGRAILERTVVHVPDAQPDAEYMPEFIRLAGFSEASSPSPCCGWGPTRSDRR